MIKFDKFHSNGRVWISSDIHYGHKNICRGVTNWRTSQGEIPIDSTRDFDTVEQMNSTIVDRINSKVGQNDTFILLGDIAFGGFENIGIFLDRLVCKNIYLILGNHDQHIKNDRGYIKSRFMTVSNYAELNIDGANFVLSHYPFASWHGLNKGVIHLHGHVHLSPKNKWGNGKKLDVGLDGNNYYPYSITEIVHMMDKREVGSDVTNDHHLDDMVGVVG